VGCRVEAATSTGSLWTTLEPGLELGEFPAPQRSGSGDSIVRALRIDPERFELTLLNASAPGEGELRTARGWCERHRLVAAINASMYQTDYRSSVSLMRTREHVNNIHLSKDKAVLAFDRRDGDVPKVQIIDRECQDFAAVSPHYGTLVQSIRMLSCDGRNVWKQQPLRSSTAAIGVDRRGRVLFLHVRSPYSTHDLIEILKGLPLDLRSAMYVEGGPEAQLYVAAGGAEHEFLGSFETRLHESDDRIVALPVPNVVGVARKRR
jgi:uncharacterized protein YigE (DUF2233 family)